jgi:hypothetical protein
MPLSAPFCHPLAFFATWHTSPIPAPPRADWATSLQKFSLATTGVNFSKNNLNMMFLFVFLCNLSEIFNITSK